MGGVYSLNLDTYYLLMAGNPQIQFNSENSDNQETIIQWTSAYKDVVITIPDTSVYNELLYPSRLTHEICAFLSRETFTVYLEFSDRTYYDIDPWLML